MNFILANCSHGQRINGIDKTPKILFNNIKQLYKFYSYSIIEKDDFRTIKGYRKIYNDYIKFNRYKRKIAIFGGDHSIAQASCQAFLDIYKDKGHILWIDAHTDINTFETSISKNSHGMPVSKLLGINSYKYSENHYLANPSQITYIGPRSIDKSEQTLLDILKIDIFTSDNINRDINNVVDKINSIIKDKFIHISYDIDILDPSYIKCTGTKEDKGIDIITNNTLLKSINKTKLVSADFVELNLDIDKKRKTTELEHMKDIINIVLNS